MAENRLQRALDYLAAARTMASSAGTTILLAAAALLVIWLSSLEDLASSTNELVRIKRTLATPRSFSGLTDEDIATLSKKAATLADVPFNIFAVEFAVPPVLAPSFWLLGALITLAVAFNARRTTFRRFARALRLLTESDAHPQTDPRDVFGNAPTWLAPHPTAKGLMLEPTSFLGALGWTKNYNLRRLVVGFVFLLFWAVVLRNTVIAFAINEALAQGIHQIALTIFLLGILACLIGLTALWWRAYPVPDDYDDDFPSPNRRTLILGVLSMAGALGILRIFRPATRPISRNPRYPRRPRRRAITQTTLQQGFYIRPPGTVAHYVDSHRQIRDAKQLRIAALHPLTVVDLQNEGSTNPIHINRSTASYAIEDNTIALLRSNKIDEAMSLLMFGIQQILKSSSRVPDRLADLFAALSIGYRRTSALDDLIKLIESRPSEKARFKQELEKWRNPPQSYVKKFTHRSTKSPWYGLLMQDTR